MGAQADALGVQLRRQVAKAAVALVLEIDAELRKSPDAGGTPVDTGHARANWVPSVGAPATGEVNGDGAHEAGIAALLGYQLEQGALWLANAAPYIEQLNLGHSHQAPPGFIEAAIERAQVIVQGRYDSLRIEINTRGAGTFVDLAGGNAAGNLASAYSPFGGDDA